MDCVLNRTTYASQSFGTMTSWRGDRCEHTSSIDAATFYQKVAKDFKVPLVGIVAAQHMKLLRVSLAKTLAKDMVYWPAFE